ncbi:DUF58 domain-containing protein [Bacillus sp. 2205SS5-2]|uniref:DUF58 domain-containing protein n=1 Tax=Bacillus sp. 2205SS5-2 TaxID=3109031 RepID=UPI0030069B37
MQWKKETVEMPYVKLTQHLIGILLLLSIIIQQFAMALAFLFCAIIVIGQNFYIRSVGQKISIENSKVRERLIVGGQSELTFTFENKGLPVWQSNLTIIFDDSLKPEVGGYLHRQSEYEVKIPLTLPAKKRCTVSLPVYAQKRGLVKIKQIQLSIPNLVGSGLVLLHLSDPFLEEKLIYPNIHHVKGELQSFSQFLGDVPTPQTLFLDPFLPIGTREYQSGDSFQHIHWKATARSQVLHTKVFETTTDHSWLFMLNVLDRYSITAELDAFIEGMTYLIEKAYKENHSYSMAINIRSILNRPYFYLPVGNGEAQRRKALDVLATLSNNDATIPCELMQQQLFRGGDHPPLGIHVGKRSQEIDTSLRVMNRNGMKIFTLEFSKKQGELKQWIIQ